MEPGNTGLHISDKAELFQQMIYNNNNKISDMIESCKQLQPFVCDSFVALF